MTALKMLEDHHFWTEVKDNGRFIGRVGEFPDIRTKQWDNSLDALDEVMTLTRDKLRQLEDTVNPLKGPAPR